MFYSSSMMQSMYLALNSNLNLNLNLIFECYETKSYLPLVKELQILKCKWANVNSYPGRVCEKRIFGSFWDFSRKVWIPFKFKQDSIWSLFLKFIIQNLKRFWIRAKKENCSIWNYLSACHVWRIFSKRKVMFCIFELGAFDLKWKSIGILEKY
jgi:hypothetical protein